MLSDRNHQLLTAYVDGELDERQRAEAERLLADSSEARDQLARLEQDAHLLRNLPSRKAHPDFARKVVAALESRGVHGTRRSNLAESPTYPAWTGLAAAAAVLLVVGISSYFFLSAYYRQDQDRNTLVKKGQDNKPDKIPQGPGPEQPQEPIVEKKPEPNKEPVVKAPLEKSPSDQENPPMTPKKDPAENDLAIPTPKPFKLEEVQVKLALSLPVHELDQEKARHRLREEMQPDKAYRLDLFAEGNGKAAERLQETLKAQGFQVFVDQLAQLRLKDRRLKGDYVLFTEDLKPEEWAKLLEKLGDDDKKAAAKKPADQQFSNVVVRDLTKPDHAELCELLGVDPLDGVAGKHPSGVDIRKELSEQTAEELAQALKGKGPPRPEPGKPVNFKPTDKVLVVLPYQPVRVKPANSRELKQFLDSRKARKAGTISVVIYLRDANG